MSVNITQQPFVVMAAGEAVWSYILQNEYLTVRASRLGATLRRLVFRGDMVLGYDSLEDYIHSDGYVGATVGRVCNWVGGAYFTLNGVTYPLVQNDGSNHLHNGISGFDRHIWSAGITQNGVCLSRTSPDGEEG